MAEGAVRPTVPGPPVTDTASAEAHRFALSAMHQVGRTVSYDASYVPLKYPGGDVPIDRGVCTDVVVRAFRDMGVDLQVEVHQDMRKHFSAYPKRWGLDRPDTNIDHRRVPNLQTFLRREGKELPVTSRAQDYQPGDIVTWEVLRRPHIGLVSTIPTSDGQRFHIVHNFGAGTQVEDQLFRFKITGHYRWF